MSPDALTGLEANLRFGGTRDDGDAHLRPAVRVAELDLHPAQRGRRKGRAQGLRQGRQGAVRFRAGLTERAVMEAINYSEKIPNNVNLAGDRTLQRALEHWQPNFLQWWAEMGPDGSQATSTCTCARRSASTRAAGRTSTT